jgi:hypothetical protein
MLAPAFFRLSTVSSETMKNATVFWQVLPLGPASSQLWEWGDGSREAALANLEKLRGPMTQFVGVLGRSSPQTQLNFNGAYAFRRTCRRAPE